MLPKLLCALIGYALGNFLTADLVCRFAVGKSVFDVGVGNPGMANVGHELGTGPAIAVLAGDILKTVLAWAAAQLICPGDGLSAGLAATLGTTLGHNFPAWHRFKGGKGVTTTCSAIILASPVAGVCACLVGLATVIFSGYLCFGAVAITLAFALLMLLGGAGADVVCYALAFALLMAQAHGSAMRAALEGTQRRASISVKFWEKVRGKRR
ncbi:MAG: glycerol-3-phosphate acyltransferase [Olsenella sp.]|nr:glycerol-3-phosphate acyltransferase [Olsenella sp.]